MRTLFHEPTGDLSIHESPVSSEETGHYKWLAGIQTLNIGDHRLLVNPSNGGWVELAPDEYSRVMPAHDPPQGIPGQFLYSAGLCTRNASQKQFKVRSEFTEDLYFFEFATTNACNLACTYCFADASPRRSRETASRALTERFIDRIAEYRAATNSVTPFVIEFTGGEPLLNFPVIRHAVEYAEKTYDKLLGAQFVIQSNLTALTDEIINFASAHNISIGASCDGFRSIHDRQRPMSSGRGSHRRVELKMRKLCERMPHNSGGVITVITEDSTPYMAEIALYLHLCGYNHVSLKPLARLGRGIDSNSRQPFAQAYATGLVNVLTSVIIPLFQEGRGLVLENHLSNTLQHLLQPYRTFMCERSPCGAARNICIVMPNGDVYPCNQSTGDGVLLLGNINDASFIELLDSPPARMLNARTVEAIEECRNCVLSSWCGSPCPHEAYTKRGDFFARSAQCDIFRHRYLAVLEGLLDDRFDLSVVGELAEVDGPATWRSENCN